MGAGDTTFDINYSGQIMGSTTIKDLVLVPGSQDYDASFLFAPTTPDAQKAGAELLGNFLTSKDSSLLILGNKNSTPIASLLPTFQVLSLNTTLKGLTQKVLNAMGITVSKFSSASMDITNALNIGYKITGIVASLSSDGKEIGSINLPKSPFPTIVKPLSKQTVENIPITLTGNPPVGKQINVDVDVTVFIDMNGFTGAVHFTEKDVPTDIKSSSSKTSKTESDTTKNKSDTTHTKSDTTNTKSNTATTKSDTATTTARSDTTTTTTKSTSSTTTTTTSTSSSSNHQKNE